MILEPQAALIVDIDAQQRRRAGAPPLSAPALATLVERARHMPGDYSENFSRVIRNQRGQEQADAARAVGEWKSRVHAAAMAYKPEPKKKAAPAGLPVPHAAKAPYPPKAPAPAHAIRSVAAPVSMDAASRTVDVVWSTGARASNHVAGLGHIIEELDMRPASVRMGLLIGGRAPVLDTHQRSGARSVLGRVVAARLEGGCGYATLQFTAAPDAEPVWQRIADGTLRGVSVGYRVYRYDKIVEAGSRETIHRAVDWEPFEISIVALATDPAAAVRGGGRQGAPLRAIEPALA